jgi:hypothetical protein
MACAARRPGQEIEPARRPLVGGAFSGSTDIWVRRLNQPLALQFLPNQRTERIRDVTDIEIRRIEIPELAQAEDYGLRQGDQNA